MTSAEAAQKRTVCSHEGKGAFVYKLPGKGSLGILKNGKEFDVMRFSPSQTFAYGFARGSINKKAWIKVTELCQ